MSALPYLQFAIILANGGFGVALPLNLRRGAFDVIFALNCEIRLPLGLCFSRVVAQYD